MTPKFAILFALLSPLLVVSQSEAAVVALSAGTYTQNFDSIGSGLPDGWDVRTASTASLLGTAATLNTANTVAWNSTTGGFRNSSSFNAGSTANAAAQTANTNRSLSFRQTGSLGDPGGSFNFNFSTIDQEVTAITIDLGILDSQPRSTTWTIQYGVGASPTSFTTLATFSDPGAFGATGFNITTGLEALEDQSQLWFRVVALGASTGSGNRDTFGIDNFTITTAAVPEPAAALLGSVGLIGLLRRRRIA